MPKLLFSMGFSIRPTKCVFSTLLIPNFSGSKKMELLGLIDQKKELPKNLGTNMTSWKIT